LDLMVINTLTYRFMTNELIYCNCDETRNKIISLIEKKVPNKAVNAKLKKFIIKYLLAQADFDLLDRLLAKWIGGNSNSANSIDHLSIIDFIQSLQLDTVWYSAEKFKYEETCLVDELLLQTMNRVFKMCNNNLALINRLTMANIFDDLNAAFYFRSILAFLNQENEQAYLTEVDSDKFYALLVENLRNDSSNKNKTVIYFVLIDALFYFDNELDTLSSCDKLLELIDSIEYNEPNECLFNLILSKYDEKHLQELIWQSYLHCDIKRMDSLKKNLLLQSIYFSKLSEEGFNQLEWIESDDQTNLVEYLIDKFILANLSNVNPQLRALCVRSLGLASLTCFQLAESYVYMMSQV